jgi:hypothetical protein
MWKWSHYAITEVVEPFKLHPTSISYIYGVFEHLKQMWIGIWQHTHTVTTTDSSQDLRELAEILDDVSVEMIQLRYRWGCRTFQTASHIHEIYIYIRFLNTSNSCGWAYGSTLIPLHHRCYPRFGKVLWNHRWCKCGNDPTTLSLRW